MKKLLILTFLFTNLILGFSQKVEVISLDQKIEKMPRIGLATYIELDKSQVENL